MIRVRLAAWLLRTTGANVEYGVRRVKAKLVRGKGSTVLATAKLGEAIAKCEAMRIADADAATITLTTIIKERRCNLPTPSVEGEQT